MLLKSAVNPIFAVLSFGSGKSSNAETDQNRSKLKAFDIGDPLFKWFQSYLTERKQRVAVNGTYSAWTDVGSGVPQGSLLGPILFLLFVNDMPRVVENASLAMFADDSKCYKVIYQESDFVNLQRDLDALSTWSVSNELFFQPTKMR